MTLPDHRRTDIVVSLHSSGLRLRLHLGTMRGRDPRCLVRGRLDPIQGTPDIQAIRRGFCGAQNKILLWGGAVARPIEVGLCQNYQPGHGSFIHL